MFKSKSSLFFSPMLLLFLLSQILTSSALAQYKPPKTPPPKKPNPAGSRNPETCIEANQEIPQIVPIIPNYSPELAPELQDFSNYGLSLSPTPTLFIYLPKSNATMGELVIKTQSNRSVVVRRQFILPNQAGIVSLNLADLDIQPLQTDQFYRWNIRIICNPNNTSENPTTPTIWLKVIQPSDSFQEQITNTQPLALPSLYAQGDEKYGGFWYDTVSSLVKLQQSDPSNSDLQQQWQDLFQSTGLENLTAQPLLDCCQFQE